LLDLREPGRSIGRQRNRAALVGRAASGTASGKFEVQLRRSRHNWALCYAVLCAPYINHLKSEILSRLIS